MLYQKNNSAPLPLPFSDFDEGGNNWTDLANSPEGREATGWTEAPAQPNYDPLTQTVFWGEGGWEISDLPKPQLPDRLRVTKADFQRLLAPQERYKLNALRKVIAALEPEDYSDPANALIVAAEDVMFAFEQPAEFIELDHPDTSMGLALLSYLDVIAAERIPAIVGNQPPA
jgi:hypothetical protein